LNDRASAEQSLEKSLQYANDSDEVLHLVFDGLNLLGKSEDAARIGHQSLWGHRPWATETVRAFKNFNNRKYQDAIPDFKLVADKGHAFDRLFARYMLGRIYIELKQYDGAIQALREVVATPVTRSAWEYAEFHYTLAKAYSLKGDQQSAKEHYKTFLNIWRLADPERPEIVEARKRVKS
jgi:tetratricopeptide (TPR) repeat protein